MSTTSSPHEELTPEQFEVARHLPNTTAEVAKRTNLSTSAVRGRLRRIQSGLVYRDQDGLWVWDGDKDLHRMKTHHTGSVTRAANNFLVDDEAGIKALLNQTEPATHIPETKPGNEDLVIPLGDLHYGDYEDGELDEECYSTKIADKRTKAIVVKAIQEAREQPAEYDTVHLLLLGDLVTGNGIYKGQWADLEWLEDHCSLGKKVPATIKHQINLAAETLMWVIKTLAKEFDSVQVVCQPGNHGENRASGVSEEANADIHVCSRLDFGVRHCGLENINFIFHDSTSYTNFTMRGGKMKGHLRHGEECQYHAGATSASKRDWRGWLIMHDFDVAIRGHYHTAKIEDVMGVPVIMNGSPKPPGDFEESISVWGGPGSVIFGVTDDQAPKWTRYIEF